MVAQVARKGPARGIEGPGDRAHSSRRRAHGAALGALTGLAIAIAPPRAWADGEEPLRIEYRGIPVCPSQAEFVDAVRARTARWRDALVGESARRFVIDVASRGGAVHGRLIVTTVRQEEARREVVGASCAVVVETLALMTALAIDPLASLAPALGVPPGQAASPARIVARPLVAKVAPTAPAPPAAAWRMSAGSHAMAGAGMAPDLTVGLDAFIDVRYDRPGTVMSPSARLLLEGIESGLTATRAGTARFDRLLGGLELCPMRISLGTAPLSFVPCATFDAGVVDGIGLDTARARTRGRLWMTAGLAGRLAWTLTHRVEFEAGGGAVFPATRDTFLFPSLPVYAVPLVAGFARVGVALRFR